MKNTLRPPFRQAIASSPQWRGFTLVELLTVIAIIGILAAILIPTVGKVRQSALKTRSVANLKNIGAALSLYASEHKDTLPKARTTGDKFWPVDLWPYLQNPDVLVRPGVDLVNGPGRSDPTTTANTKNPVTGELLVFCYVVNGGGRTVPFPDLMYPAVPLSAISAPSQLIALGEMSDSNPAWLNVMSGATINYTLLNDRLRHENPGGAALLLFLDGHTALMKPDTIEVRNICWEY